MPKASYEVRQRGSSSEDMRILTGDQIRAKIAKGINDANAGRVKPASVVLAEIAREKHRLSVNFRRYMRETDKNI